MGTKLQNSNCDKTQKLKLGQNKKSEQTLKTKMVTKLKISNWDITKIVIKKQKLRL